MVMDFWMAFRVAVLGDIGEKVREEGRKTEERQWEERVWEGGEGDIEKLSSEGGGREGGGGGMVRRGYERDLKKFRLKSGKI